MKFFTIVCFVKLDQRENVLRMYKTIFLYYILLNFFFSLKVKVINENGSDVELKRWERLIKMQKAREKEKEEEDDEDDSRYLTNYIALWVGYILYIEALIPKKRLI